MKILLLLLFIPIISLSQEKGVNTIIVKGVSFDTVAYKLLDAGYFIDKKDTIFKTIVTSPKVYKTDWLCKMIVQVRIKDRIAFISGEYNMDIVSASIDLRTYSPIVNKGMKGSAAKVAFVKLNEFALSLSGEISYLKQ